jgi:AraC family transcriptional regulator of adaptative response / DNA-3-methyladenine glycosylase II
MVTDTATADGEGAYVVRLRPVAPYAGADLLGFVGARAIPGVEEFDGRTYRRVLRAGNGHAIVELSTDEADVVVRVTAGDPRQLEPVLQHCRRLADTDRDPAAIAAALGADPLLADSVRRAPGLRVPGTVDPFELAIRAVLGQQVSVAGARTLAGRLCGRHGTVLPMPSGDVTRLFPRPEALAEGDLDGLGVTGARIRTIRAISRAVADGSLLLASGVDLLDTEGRLLALPGIGPWTAAYIAMRALGDADAFPAGDLGVRRAFERGGVPADIGAITARADAWRPWRAYAAHHLWAGLRRPSTTRGD